MTGLLLKLFVRDSKNINSAAVREKYGVLAGAVGIVCNLLLCAFKLLIGILSGSLSVVADALNNLTDTASSIITLIGFRLSNKPADREHPYGHGRIEYMAGFIVSSLILLVGLELAISSVEKIITPTAVKITAVTFAVLICAILVKLWMFVFYKKLSKIIDSAALAATAQDCLNDTLTTAAILISTVIIYVWGINIDAYVGLLMSAFIIYSGIKSAKETINPLLGTPPKAETIRELENIIRSFEMFHGIHDLIVHNYGQGRSFASVHIEVPDTVDIVACHEQVDLCEKLVLERMNLELVIHMDPTLSDDEAVLNTKAELIECVRSIDERLSIHDFRMTPKGKDRTNLIFDVVVPSEFSLSNDALCTLIEQKMRRIDKTYCCVITVDNDFTGN